MEETFTELLNQIQAGSCVCFIGAGFSVPGGMPTWHQLLKNLHDLAIRDNAFKDEGSKLYSLKCIEDSNFIAAANVIAQVLPKHKLIEHVRASFHSSIINDIPAPQKKRMRARINNLVKGPWAGVVTTNFDTLVQDVINYHGYPGWKQLHADDAELGTLLLAENEPDRFCVALHGSIASGEVVLSSEQYSRHYLEKAFITTFLEALMLQYRLVFVGCSLRDHILEIRKTLFRSFSGNIPACYALLPSEPSNAGHAAELKREAGVKTILYPKKRKKNELPHGFVDSFFKTTSSASDSR